jgi:CRP-like cAMP-binding protein
VPFGEIGRLRGTPRGASARAEDDVVLVPSRAAIDRLAAEHLRLHAQLLLNLCRHVAARLATVTVELQDALRA